MQLHSGDLDNSAQVVGEPWNSLKGVEHEISSGGPKRTPSPIIRLIEFVLQESAAKRASKTVFETALGTLGNFQVLVHYERLAVNRHLHGRRAITRVQMNWAWLFNGGDIAHKGADRVVFVAWCFSSSSFRVVPRLRCILVISFLPFTTSEIESSMSLSFVVTIISITEIFLFYSPFSVLKMFSR